MSKYSLYRSYTFFLCVTVTENYIDQCKVTLFSIFEHNPYTYHTLYILAVDVQERQLTELKKLLHSVNPVITIEIVKYTKDMLSVPKIAHDWTNGNMEICSAKIKFMHDFKDEFDRSISKKSFLNFVDIDTVCVSEFKMPSGLKINNSRMFGVSEPTVYPRWAKSGCYFDTSFVDHNYFNAGFLIFTRWDRDLWGEYHLFLENHNFHVRCCEQDFLNFKFKNYKYNISPRYNYMNINNELYPEDIFKPYIYHYLGSNKPWNTNNIDRYPTNYSYYYLYVEKYKDMLSKDFCLDIYNRRQLVKENKCIIDNEIIPKDQVEISWS